MNIAELSIRRPVATTLVMLAILVFGLFAYRLLPVSDLPNVDFPTIVVSAALPGATPDTMAASVATPLEKQFSTIAGIDSMSSTSMLGSTQITLQFTLDRNIDDAAMDVQSAITASAKQLPPTLPNPPTYQKVNPSLQPVLYIALTSPTLPLNDLDEYGETLIAQRLSMVSGVAQVLVYGAQKYAARIQLDPTALAYRGIGIDEVSRAVNAANVNLPTGVLQGSERAYQIEADGQLLRAEGYRPVIVAYRNGNPIRIRDIGRVIDGVENDKTAAWFVGQRAVILAIQRQPGTNTVEVTDGIKAVLPVLELQLPKSVTAELLFDRSNSIRESVRDVQFTLVLTLCLVVLVIFLFLRNLRATLIPSLSLPFSIIGTFAVMYLLDYSLDNLSLMALTLATGFVVDDAIVMLENIVRHVEAGEGVFEAAISGSREIAFTIVSMTISLAAVFIPVLFMGGIPGRLFREFAVTIGVAILVSGFVSLTLTPMLASRFLKPEEKAERRNALFRALEAGFDWTLRVYDVSLYWCLRHRLITTLAFVVTVAGSVLLFVVTPKGFLPDEDLGFLFAQTEGAEGISFQALVRHQQAVAAVIGTDRNVDVYMSSAGGRGGMGASNTGFIFVRLKPRAERNLSAIEVMQVLRKKVSVVPGINVYFQNPASISVGGRFTQAAYQYTLQCGDTDLLYKNAAKLEAKLRGLTELQDVTSDLRLRNPQVEVHIDRDKASALGVTAAQIEDSLFTAYGTRQISTIYAAQNTYQVIMELLPEYQLSPQSLGLLYVRSAGGTLVPLSTVVRLVEDVGPLSINHTGQAPSVTISYNLKPGVALSQAVAKINESSAALPSVITGTFQGAAQAFKASQANMKMLLVMAVLVIYIVLGILYESFIHPFTILSGLPAAGFGALLTLVIFRCDLNLYSFIGIIMLVGLVKKNGIMMVDFAIEAQRKEGKTAIEAIHHACIVRFRPIMMTTFAALMGALPIAIGWGAGGESRRPLGLAVVGGLIFSQFLTLYITPVFFIYLDRFGAWVAGLFRGETPPEASGAGRAPSG
jgi:HAE1 family hydrophobic/amphiphilic exporter-1